jgi:hypothetical protein
MNFFKKAKVDSIKSRSKMLLERYLNTAVASDNQLINILISEYLSLRRTFYIDPAVTQDDENLKEEILEHNRPRKSVQEKCPVYYARRQ